MKLLIALLLAGNFVNAQPPADSLFPLPVYKPFSLPEVTPAQKDVIKLRPQKWKMNGNRWLTGSLIMVGGASKGFNETLLFHWREFQRQFPKANPRWFNPAISWKNKYKNRDPKAGAKFPLSTSVLVMLTDQYHLNSFINRTAWATTVAIKIGEGKKPFKHYLLDFLYYTICHQAGFALTYYPFKK